MGVCQTHGKFPSVGDELRIEVAVGTGRGVDDCGLAVSAGDTKPFLYWRDPVCLAAGAAYVGNRWLLPLALQAPWWRGHFADVLLIPAGLPCWLWLERRLGWRRDDAAPRWGEIAFLVVTWTLAAELLAPRVFIHCTGDLWDAAAYVGGAVVAGLAWRWHAA